MTNQKQQQQKTKKQKNKRKKKEASYTVEAVSVTIILLGEEAESGDLCEGDPTQEKHQRQFLFPWTGLGGWDGTAWNTKHTHSLVKACTLSLVL